MSVELQDTCTAAGGERLVLRPEAADSLGLSAVLHRPARGAAGPVASKTEWAVLAPGWAGDRCGPGEIFVPLAEALLAADGLKIGAVLRFDVSGRGEARGEYATSDLDAMVDDGVRALAVAALQAGASESSPVTVHLIGMCSGGNVALGLCGLWARMAARDEEDLKHLPPAVVVALRAVRLKTVQAISTFPFQEMRPEELNDIRQQQNRRKTVSKLFQLESYKKLLTGRLNPTRILKNWFESEPGAKASAGDGGGGAAGEGAAPVNRKLSRRDLLAGLAVFAREHAGALQFLYADGDPEGVASAPVYAEYFAAERAAAVPMQILPGCNHNFYGRAARAQLLPAIVGFCGKA